MRGELRDWPHVHVCDVYPGFVDSPGLAHSANYTGRRLRAAPPVLDTAEVARAMVEVCKRPRRVVSVGASARLARLGRLLVPGLTSWLGAAVVRSHFRFAESAPRTHGNLFSPSVGHGVHGSLKAQQRQNQVGRGKLLAAFAALAGGVLLSRLLISR